MKEREETEDTKDPSLPLLTLPIECTIKRPIIDGFQNLRCLWKRLDKTLQSILSSKTTVLRSVPFRNCCTLLALPISPKLMDGF